MSIRIALAGNPNCGKTTLFNALTGSNQFVGNWPGVTVEKKEGKLKGKQDVIVTDLPGIYSLSPYTLEEVVARNYLLNEKPEVILNIIDGTNLERNLYLTTQLAELGIPMVLAVNMMDIIQKNGEELNLSNLSQQLGFPAYEISALKGIGIQEAAEAAIQAASNSVVPVRLRFHDRVEHALREITDEMLTDVPESLKRWYAVKLFERDEKVLEKMNVSRDRLEKIITACEQQMNDESESIIIAERYDSIESIIQGCYKKRNRQQVTISDKIDRILTNRFLALPIFAAIMFIVYYISVTTVGTIVTDFTNDTLFGKWIIPSCASALESIGCADWLQGLLVDGMIGGVGAVIGFVPQMLVLFIFLAFLEACGYMARVAFIMDRIFRKFGLSGKSFIPMLIGTGCGVPGIMASRTIENDRDRKMTIITTTFIPCSAKMPIVALIAGALFGGAWWVAPSAYFTGVAAVVISGIILKKTKRFAGDTAPFVMELPAYHMPTVINVLRSMWERGWSFIKKAGTVILLSTVVIWFLQSFSFEGGFHMMDAGDPEVVETSILAIIGKAFAWIFLPLGFGNWQSAVATLTGLIAKENVVGTFGVLYGFAEVGEEGTEIWQALAQNFTTVSAYAFMVFNLLCAPCFAAMGAIKREMNNGKWTAFAITYQCIFAYAIALCVNQFGMLFTGGSFGIGTVAAILVAAGIVFLLVRPQKKLIQSKRAE
ncbi:MAG: ferrous iron transport protein B [Ruminococcus sp.]